MAATRRAFISGIGGFAVSSCATPDSATLSLAEIIERHTQARGGPRVLDAVHAQDANITIVEHGSSLDARYRCTSEPAYRIDIFSGGQHVFCEGLDARGPWLWPADAAAPRDGVADARRTAIQGIEFNLYGLHRFAERGHQVVLDGREIVDGINYFIIRVTMRDGYETFLYIDPTTWMVGRRRDFRAFHPDMDATRRFTEKQYLDYRSADGVMTPYGERQVDLGNGALVNETTVRSIRYLPSFTPGLLGRDVTRPNALEQP